MKSGLVKGRWLVLSMTIVLFLAGCTALEPRRAATAPVPAAPAPVRDAVAPNPVDTAALEKLRRMDPAQVEELDRRLAEALTFYYDRQFGQALPLFQQIADRVETMDIMFWVGTSAMETGQMELAEANFQKMLAVDPELHRARLELAAVYFKTGRLEEARRELNRVKAAAPPPAVQQNIEKLLGAIEEQSKKAYWSASVSQGYMWDTNASAGPELKQYTLSGGTFTPSATTARVKDQVAVTVLTGALTYDLAEKNGLMWNTAVFAYNQAYMDYSQFNYAIVDLSTGPWWVDRQNIVKLPFGLSHADYASDRLFWAFHFDPSIEHYFNAYLSLKGQWSYRHEDYYRGEQSNLDNKSNTFEVTPTLYLDNRRHMLSASAAWEDHNAYADRFTYDGPVYGLSYLWRIASRTELYFSYKWNRREYNGRAVVNADRYDERSTYTAAVSQGFGKHLFGSFAYNHMKNDSNIDLFEFERKTYTLNAGCRF